MMQDLESKVYTDGSKPYVTFLQASLENDHIFDSQVAIRALKKTKSRIKSLGYSRSLLDFRQRRVLEGSKIYSVI